MRQSAIKVAIVGVGNCASALVQAIYHYSQAQSETQPPGLIIEDIGGYLARDIQVVAGFDVSADKVGLDLSEAIFAQPNNTFRFANPAPFGVVIQRGPTLDGIGEYLQDVVPLSDDAPVDVAQVLRDSGAQILINYLPVGSQQATEHYLEAALAAGCAVVNCIPVFVASNPVWAQRFTDAGLPIIGDDIKSQVGATIVHRTLVKLMQDRGIQMKRMYQLNFGGNTDFQNMLERSRLTSKKISKTRAVTSLMDTTLPEDDVHVGPSDFVPWLEDRKWAHIRLEGTGIGGAPLNIELKLEVWDSPNSAAVVLDAIRCARLALDRGDKGPIAAVSSYYMKSPPVPKDDETARAMVMDYIGATAQVDRV
jgi:myo-inositol-1-phosphate synthase